MNNNYSHIMYIEPSKTIEFVFSEKEKWYHFFIPRRHYGVMLTFDKEISSYQQKITEIP